MYLLFEVPSYNPKVIFNLTLKNNLEFDKLSKCTLIKLAIILTGTNLTLNHKPKCRREI